MIQSSNLVDYMRTDAPTDLHQATFPGYTAEELKLQWEDLANSIVVDLQMKVKGHIDTLHIPEMHEPLNASVFPVDMHLMIAAKIDDAKPLWNVVQKAIAFNVYIHELYNQARNDLFNRIRDKHNRKMELLNKVPFTPKEPTDLFNQ